MALCVSEYGVRYPEAVGYWLLALGQPGSKDPVLSFWLSVARITLAAFGAGASLATGNWLLTTGRRLSP